LEKESEHSAHSSRTQICAKLALSRFSCTWCILRGSTMIWSLAKVQRDDKVLYVGINSQW